MIEGDFGQERFLLEHPVLLAREGKFEKVPMLTGVTTDEFAGRAVGKHIYSLSSSSPLIDIRRYLQACRSS